jgi:hypothetical protein
MLKGLTIWGATFLVVLIAFILHWELVWVMILIAGGVILAIGVLYSRYKVDKEYSRDPEAALLMGRYSISLDHKGRMTQQKQKA